MCKHDDGCNAPEGECSGACMTQQTSSETLEKIVSKYLKEFGVGSAMSFTTTLLSDPAILDHIPEVKALREELESINEDLSREVSIGNEYIQTIRSLESQLAKLRQGGEAGCVGKYRVCNQRDNTGVIAGLPEHTVGTDVFVYSARPQPAIPPDYAPVPIEPTEEMIDAGLAFTDNKLLWHISRGAAQDFYKAMLASAPAIQPQAAEPVDEQVAKFDHSKLQRYDCFEVTRTRFGETETEAVMKPTARGPYVLFDDVEAMQSKASAESGG